MERKHKIGLILLALLLAAAIIGIFVVRGQLTDREADYAAAMSQLDEQETEELLQSIRQPVSVLVNGSRGTIQLAR